MKEKKSQNKTPGPHIHAVRPRGEIRDAGLQSLDVPTEAVGF